MTPEERALELEARVEHLTDQVALIARAVRHLPETPVRSRRVTRWCDRTSRTRALWGGFVMLVGFGLFFVSLAREDYIVWPIFWAGFWLSVLGAGLIDSAYVGNLIRLALRR